MNSLFAADSTQIDSLTTLIPGDAVKVKNSEMLTDMLPSNVAFPVKSLMWERHVNDFFKESVLFGDVLYVPIMCYFVMLYFNKCQFVSIYFNLLFLDRINCFILTISS